MLRKPTAWTFAPGQFVIGGTRGQPRIPRLTVLLCLFGALAGCGAGQRPSPPTPIVTATHQALATPAHSPPLPSPTLGTIIWTTHVDATTGAPADSVSEYPPQAARIIAAIPTTALPAGATIDAAWFYNDTSLDAFNTRVTLPDRAAQRWVGVQLARQTDAPWPAGTYEVVVSLNGAEIQRASVMVGESS